MAIENTFEQSRREWMGAPAADEIEAQEAQENAPRRVFVETEAYRRRKQFAHALVLIGVIGATFFGTLAATSLF